jgi:hypothetical protein
MGMLLSIIGAVVTLGSVFIGIGVVKGKVSHAVEINATQSKQIENCASKTELTQAIKRSDEMLELMRKRTEEDRVSGEGKYRELYRILNDHAERIRSVETAQTSITKILDEIKTDLNGGFRDIRSELKELRKQD